MLVVAKRSRDDERVDPCCRRGCACTSFVFPCLSTAFVRLHRHCPHNEPVYSWRSTVYENKPEWAPPRPPHSSLPTVPSISFDLTLASCPNPRHRPPRRPHVPRPRSTHPSAARPVHKLLLTSCLPPVIQSCRQLGHSSSRRSARSRHRLSATGEHRLQPSPPAVGIHLCQLCRLVRVPWRSVIRRQHIGQHWQGRQRRQPFPEWIVIQHIAGPGASKKGQWEKGNKRSSA